MTQKKPTLIYIMGCCRSGSTLLDIMLGNNSGVTNTGELMYYSEFNGCPNGFGPNTDNHHFWQKVTSDMQASLPAASFDDFNKLTHHFEDNASAWRWLANIPSSKTEAAHYKTALNTLISLIFQHSGSRFLIDSSKNPGRALNLSRYLENVQLRVIYLHRRRRDVIASFSKVGLAQPRKNPVSARLYYSGVHFLCRQASRRLGNDIVLPVSYDALVADPIPTLHRIQEHCGLPVNECIAKLEKNQPLDPGYIFNGNRMRLNKEIYLQRST